MITEQMVEELARWLHEDAWVPSPGNPRGPKVPYADIQPYQQRQYRQAARHLLTRPPEVLVQALGGECRPDFTVATTQRADQ